MTAGLRPAPPEAWLRAFNASEVREKSTARRGRAAVPWLP